MFVKMNITLDDRILRKFGGGVEGGVIGDHSMR
jgi:hypothetical protein